MIVDKFENVALYRNLGSALKKGFDFLKTADLLTITSGIYDISDGIFAIVSEYNTKPAAECKPEAHRKYIDIQYIVEGEEYIGYAPLENQTNIEEYSSEKDLIFYKCKTVLTKLQKGMFAVYFPTDIHQPGVSINKGSKVKKVVVKIPV